MICTYYFFCDRKFIFLSSPLTRNTNLENLRHKIKVQLEFKISRARGEMPTCPRNFDCQRGSTPEYGGNAFGPELPGHADLLAKFCSCRACRLGFCCFVAGRLTFWLR